MNDARSIEFRQSWAARVFEFERAHLLLSQQHPLPEKDLLSTEHTGEGRLTPAEHLARPSGGARFVDRGQGLIMISARNVLSNLRCLGYVRGETPVPVGVTGELIASRRPFFALAGMRDGAAVIAEFDGRRRPPEEWDWFVTGVPVLVDDEPADVVFRRLVAEAADHSHVWALPRGRHPRATDESRGHWAMLHDLFVAHLDAPAVDAAETLMRYAADHGLVREGGILHNVLGVDDRGRLLHRIEQGRLEEIGQRLRALGARRALCLDNSGSSGVRYRPPGADRPPWVDLFAAPNHRAGGTAFLLVELRHSPFGLLEESPAGPPPLPARGPLTEDHRDDPAPLFAHLDRLIERRFGREGRARIRKALALAGKFHKGKCRNGATLEDGSPVPYIVHPVRIACRLIERLNVADPDLICAALLHDAVEDVEPESPGEALPDVLGEIRDELGTRTAELVSALTRGPDDLRNGRCDAPRSPYIQKLRAAGGAAILLKLSDKVDNLLDARRLGQSSKIERSLYEALATYLPLTSCIDDPTVAAALYEDLLAACAAHDADILERALDRYLLADPRAAVWIGWDGARLRVEAVPAGTLAARVARRWARLLVSACEAADEDRSSPRVAALMGLLGLPPNFLPLGPGAKERDARRAWLRAAIELEEFARLVEAGEPPAWVGPALKEPELPILIVLSLVFRPASWMFPQWLDDAGAALAATQGFAHVAPGPDEQARWRAALGMLLLHRNAVHRYARGAGSPARVAALGAVAPTGAYGDRSLWSARLLAEYLDRGGRQFDRRSQVRKEFDELWPALECRAFGDLGHGPARPGPGGLWDAVPRPSLLEVHGLEAARELFAGLAARRGTHLFERLIRILTAPSAGDYDWLIFDVEELLKRRPQFARPLADLPERLDVGDLPRYGLVARREDVAGRRLLIVRPAPRFALADRLPEERPEVIEAIEQAGFHAAATFDTLLLDRFKPGAPDAGPLWLPRVYRVLDSMGDLDPGNVQKITIHLARHDGTAGELVTWLPLPRDDDDPARQEDRERLFARFLVDQVYNAAVISRITEARVHCGAGANRGGLNDARLVGRIAELERSLGRRPQLSGYCEDFSFEPLRISGGPPPAREEVSFGRDDLVAPGRVALGIDIGGTDVKFCLWGDGKLSADGQAWAGLAAGLGQPARVVGRFPTPKPRDPSRPFSVDEFCSRLIEEVGSRLLVPWSRIDAIGLSWAGGVRENRIVAVSGVLVRLARGGADGGLEPYTYQSPANVIHTVQLAERFLALVPHPRRPHLTVALENDGSAESLGNNAARLILAGDRPAGRGSTVVLKLGTSLAGGRVTPGGAAGDEIAEYAKAFLDLNAPSRVMRDYVSSIAVRRLIRTLRLARRDPAPLFGEYGRLNRVDPASRDADTGLVTRVESEEVGLLLDLWATSDPGRSLLRDCALALVRDDDPQVEPAVARLAAALGSADLARILEAIVLDLGRILRKKIATAPERFLDDFRSIAGAGVDRVRDAGDGMATDPEEVRRLGVARLRWLVTGEAVAPDFHGVDDLPTGSAWDEALARKAVGAVAIFSRIGLHMAHAIAQLFNSYGKKTFDRVILAGGVLTGLTGEVIETQTRACLTSLYDKIYSPDEAADRPLRGAAVSRASDVVDPDALGPLGAAISALRRLKVESSARLDEAVRSALGRLPAGSEITPESVAADPSARELAPADADVRAFLERLMAERVLQPKLGHPGRYLVAGTTD